MQKLKMGVLISGSGTNLQAFIDAIAVGQLDAEIVLVVSSRPDAYGIKRAEAADIPVLVLDKNAYANPQAADQSIVDVLQRTGAEYVFMAGYMRMVTPVMLNAYPNRVVNLHPALLPSFQGAHGIQEAFDAGVKYTGVTVHFANAEYDKGPIIAQEPVPVLEDDTLESLEERIHAVEHRLYPATAQLIAQGWVSVTPDSKVHIIPAFAKTSE